MQRFRRGETGEIVATPFSGPPDLSVRSRLRKGCQSHLS